VNKNLSLAVVIMLSIHLCGDLAKAEMLYISESGQHLLFSQFCRKCFTVVHSWNTTDMMHKENWLDTGIVFVEDNNSFGLSQEDAQVQEENYGSSCLTQVHLCE